jgi:hypothetical protein
MQQLRSSQNSHVDIMDGGELRMHMGGAQWCDLHLKLHENPSNGSEVSARTHACTHINMMTP